MSPKSSTTGSRLSGVLFILPCPERALHSWTLQHRVVKFRRGNCTFRCPHHHGCENDSFQGPNRRIKKISRNSQVRKMISTPPRGSHRDVPVSMRGFLPGRTRGEKRTEFYCGKLRSARHFSQRLIKMFRIFGERCCKIGGTVKHKKYMNPLRTS